MSSHTASDTATQWDQEQLDVTRGTCKRLLLLAYEQYNEARKADNWSVASYWDGYIRGVQHVIEASDE